MDGLPKFRKPPVVETVLGVQFKPLPGLGGWRLGAFCGSLDRTEWARVSEAQPLELQHETFGEAIIREPGFRLEMVREAPLRLKIQDSDGERMMQVQNGRFHYNWLTTERKRQYPSYPKVRPEFDEAWRQYHEFLAKQGLGAVVPDQWEVTYLNHMPKGTVWETEADWSSLFQPLLGPADRLQIAKLEKASGDWRFEIEPRRGRLHVELRQGLLPGGDRLEILVLKLTARGPIDESGPSLDEGLNLGRETIVKTFREITSEQAHRYWEFLDDGP